MFPPAPTLADPDEFYGSTQRSLPPSPSRIHPRTASLDFGFDEPAEVSPIDWPERSNRPQSSGSEYSGIGSALEAQQAEEDEEYLRDDHMLEDERVQPVRFEGQREVSTGTISETLSSGASSPAWIRLHLHEIPPHSPMMASGPQSEMASRAGSVDSFTATGGMNILDAVTSRLSIVGTDRSREWGQNDQVEELETHSGGERRLGRPEVDEEGRRSTQDVRAAQEAAGAVNGAWWNSGGGPKGKVVESPSNGDPNSLRLDQESAPAPVYIPAAVVTRESSTRSTRGAPYGSVPDVPFITGPLVTDAPTAWDDGMLDRCEYPFPYPSPRLLTNVAAAAIMYPLPPPREHSRTRSGSPTPAPAFSPYDYLSISPPVVSSVRAGLTPLPPSPSVSPTLDSAFTPPSPNVRSPPRTSSLSFSAQPHSRTSSRTLSRGVVGNDDGVGRASASMYALANGAAAPGSTPLPVIMYPRVESKDATIDRSAEGVESDVFDKSDEGSPTSPPETSPDDIFTTPDVLSPDVRALNVSYFNSSPPQPPSSLMTPTSTIDGLSRLLAPDSDPRKRIKGAPPPVLRAKSTRRASAAPSPRKRGLGIEGEPGLSGLISSGTSLASLAISEDGTAPIAIRTSSSGINESAEPDERTLQSGCVFTSIHSCSSNTDDGVGCRSGPLSASDFADAYGNFDHSPSAYDSEPPHTHSPNYHGTDGPIEYADQLRPTDHPTRVDLVRLPSIDTALDRPLSSVSVWSEPPSPGALDTFFDSSQRESDQSGTEDLPRRASPFVPSPAAVARSPLLDPSPNPSWSESSPSTRRPSFEVPLLKSRPDSPVMSEASADADAEIYHDAPLDDRRPSTTGQVSPAPAAEVVPLVSSRGDAKVRAAAFIADLKRARTAAAAAVGASTAAGMMDADVNPAVPVELPSPTPSSSRETTETVTAHSVASDVSLPSMPTSSTLSPIFPSANNGPAGARHVKTNSRSPSIDENVPRISRIRALPACLMHAELRKARSAGERARLYAGKINALAKEETGLRSWVTLMGNKGTPGSTSSIFRPSSSRADCAGSSGINGRKVRQSREDPSNASSIAFPIRNDAYRAREITLGSNFGPKDMTPTVPFPGVLQSSASSSRYSTLSNASTASKPSSIHRGSFFSTLGRKGSKRSAPAAPSSSSSRNAGGYTLSSPLGIIGVSAPSGLLRPSGMRSSASMDTSLGRGGALPSSQSRTSLAYSTSASTSRLDATAGEDEEDDWGGEVE